MRDFRLRLERNFRDKSETYGDQSFAMRITTKFVKQKKKKEKNTSQNVIEKRRRFRGSATRRFASTEKSTRLKIPRELSGMNFIRAVLKPIALRARAAWLRYPDGGNLMTFIVNSVLIARFFIRTRQRASRGFALSSERETSSLQFSFSRHAIGVETAARRERERAWRD